MFISLRSSTIVNVSEILAATNCQHHNMSLRGPPRKWKSEQRKSWTSVAAATQTTSCFYAPRETNLYGTPRLIRSKKARSGEERVYHLEGKEEPSGLIDYQKLLGASVDKLPKLSSMDSEVGPFRRETGNDHKEGECCDALLENPESETRWYFKYFLGKVHHNYLCYDTEKNPFFLSVVASETIYRCILWKKTGNKRLCVKQRASVKQSSSGKQSFSGKWPSPKSLIEKLSAGKYDKSVKEVTTAAIQKDLLTLEEQEGAVNFKFGVLYARAGQKTDNEMFSNEGGSPEFSCFLDLLGDEVALHGWEHFRGGLDNRMNSTGTHSVYTVFEGHEIMFHVSTLLPYTSGNEQQVERKRHIGNDIVVIIYIDSDNHDEAYASALTFDPTCMKSHFNHIFALVTHNHEKHTYNVVVHSAESVPAFGPAIPPGGEFAIPISFRDFLLAKLINGEKAAYCTPTFAKKRERTLGLLLKGVEQKCCTEYRRTVSVPALHTPYSPNINRKQRDLEHSFTDYGQRLKVEKIITGHHPTSQRTTVALKKDPWEVECIAEEFPYQITCGDACDDGTLIVATQSDGMYFLFKDGSYSLVMDNSVPISQLAVAHRHHVLLFRTGYTKESNYLYAIPLKEFYSDRIKIGTKSTLVSYHIPYTKGCHLFCTAPLDSQFLRVAVAVKSKVYMLAYKHAANLTVNGSPVTPVTSPNPMDSFIKHRELPLADIPVLMTLLDEFPSGKLCVSYQKQTVVDAVDEIRATTQRIPNLDIARAKLTTLVSVQSNGRSELLIGYNLTCQLITLQDGTVYNSVEIIWNSEPKDIVYMSPYILAFTANTVEIRMASNGSLMQTINVPDLHLFSKKGDLYFTSTSLLHNFRPECRTPKTPSDMKFPKNIDKKGFCSSGRFQTEGMIYIYKITLEKMVRRRDSTASLPISDGKSSVSEILPEDIPSDTSSLDFVHPMIDDSEDSPLMMREFDTYPPTTAGGHGSRRKTGARRKPLQLNTDPMIETISELEDDISSSTGVGKLSVLDTVSLESSACSSPDSGVQDDFTAPMTFRTQTGQQTERHPNLHSQSSPSIL